MEKDELHRMIRVDQAGEFGATRIYEGQLAVMGDRGPHSAEIRHMAEQEEGHRAKFDALMAERGVRPTALQPFWSVAGYALGAGTALLGPEAAMACTAAVEEEIDKHYSEQLDRLAETNRWTAQVAAIVGRVFPYDVLSHIAIEQQPESISPRLEGLQQHEIIEEALALAGIRDCYFDGGAR